MRKPLLRFSREVKANTYNIPIIRSEAAFSRLSLYSRVARKNSRLQGGKSSCSSLSSCCRATNFSRAHQSRCVYETRSFLPYLLFFLLIRCINENRICNSIGIFERKSRWEKVALSRSILLIFRARFLAFILRTALKLDMCSRAEHCQV